MGHPGLYLQPIAFTSPQTCFVQQARKGRESDFNILAEPFATAKC